MRKLIVIILVLLVVAGGGAGGMMMLGVIRNPFKPPPPVKLDPVAQAAADADAKAKANAFDAPIAALPLVKMGDVLVPVLMADGINRQVFVTARIVTEASAKAAVQADLPKFIDAVLSDLIPYFQTYFLTHDLIDLKVLKKKLNRHAHEVFGDEIKEVLLINVFEAGVASQARALQPPSE